MQSETIERRNTADLGALIEALEAFRHEALRDGMDAHAVYSNQVYVTLERERLTDGSFVLNLLVRGEEG